MDKDPISTIHALAILKSCLEEYPTSHFVIIKIDRKADNPQNADVQMKTSLNDPALARCLAGCLKMVGIKDN